jgi:nicotinate phosphoribosyltransferase
MVYAAMADANHINPLNGHNQVLQDWDATYKGDLSTALTDTFTSEFFFSDFTPEQAARWKALRHDTGDTLEFGDRAISFYEKLGINPLEKTIVFSDGLTLNTIIELADYFKNRINVTFGWGTTLTNDLGVTTNNFVMKAVRVNNTPTVKLSDVSGKHTGPIEKITQYSEAVTRAIGRSALQTVVA